MGRQFRYLSYLLYKQTYLELISRNEHQKALHYLFKYIKPLEEVCEQHFPGEFKELCYLLSVKAVHNSPYFQHWPGVQRSREILADTVSHSFLDESVILEKPVAPVTLSSPADPLQPAGGADQAGLLLPGPRLHGRRPQAHARQAAARRARAVPAPARSPAALSSPAGALAAGGLLRPTAARHAAGALRPRRRLRPRSVLRRASRLEQRAAVQEHPRRGRGPQAALLDRRWACVRAVMPRHIYLRGRARGRHLGHGPHRRPFRARLGRLRRPGEGVAAGARRRRCGTGRRAARSAVLQPRRHLLHRRRVGAPPAA